MLLLRALPLSLRVQTWARGVNPKNAPGAKLAWLDVGLLKPLDERLDLGRINFRNVIALGHPRLPRAQSRPRANIDQVRNRLDLLCHDLSPQGDEGKRLDSLCHAAPPQRDREAA
jgi:hypothetical protein